MTTDGGAFAKLLEADCRTLEAGAIMELLLWRASLTVFDVPLCFFLWRLRL